MRAERDGTAIVKAYVDVDMVRLMPPVCGRGERRRGHDTDSLLSARVVFSHASKSFSGCFKAIIINRARCSSSRSPSVR